MGMGINKGIVACCSKSQLLLNSGINTAFRSNKKAYIQPPRILWVPQHLAWNSTTWSVINRLVMMLGRGRGY
ncbi:hypothetical protein Pcinc_031794 [Petrolisthes cinctipes]|uniref:Uncharacterized protein n=1 Tax=Petrolisthes cinctipes TaxID=88211 RepID=A0AAE1EVW7_PETCI|nr:hypothetical protein Pcinc_031794 [Petrolisthes cinctipes]